MVSAMQWRRAMDGLWPHGLGAGSERAAEISRERALQKAHAICEHMRAGGARLSLALSSWRTPPRGGEVAAVGGAHAVGTQCHPFMGRFALRAK